MKVTQISKQFKLTFSPKPFYSVSLATGVEATVDSTEDCKEVGKVLHDQCEDSVFEGLSEVLERFWSELAEAKADGLVKNK